MADMTTIKGKIRDTIYPNGTGAITAEKHQSLLLDMVDNINEAKQDTLVSGQNIRSLVSGTSLLGSGILHELGTAFIYEYESEQVFAMMNGTREEVKPWMLNRATASQVAQSISILRQGVLQTIVPVVIKMRAEYAIISWEYDGLIYEIAWEDDAYKVVTKPKGDEFDKQGNYPSLHVGTADDLAGRGESVPAEFGFRASGGKSIKDGRAYIKRIKGNSVVWNQQCESLLDWKIEGALSLSEDENEYTYKVIAGAVNPTKLRYRTLSGHKYMLSLEAKCSDVSQPIFICFAKADNTPIFSSSNFTETYAQYCVLMKDATDIVEAQIRTRNYAQGTTISIKKGSLQLIDLTKMFQAGNEPTTIEDFYARVATLGVDLNAYNEGEVIHCNTESIKSVGDNAWGGTLEKGRLTNGIDEVNNNMVRSDDYIRILPSQEYYALAANNIGKVNFYPSFYDADKNYISGLNATKNFSTPTNAMYMRFFLYDEGGVMPTDYNGLMITLVHSGWKQDTDAGYQPYWQDILPLPIIRKYFPDGMKSAGSAHDEIRYNKASGKWEYSKGRMKEVDMGTLNWKNLDTSNGLFYLSRQEVIDLNMATHNNENIPTNLISSLYASAPTYDIVNIDKVFRGPFTTKFSGYLTIKDTSYTDAATFKAAMQGVMLYYESNDWEWVELDKEDQNFRDYYNVADFGTEQSQSSVPSAPFSADIIYQFNAVDMIREHEIEITELQKVIATMQAQLTALTNGGQ